MKQFRIRYCNKKIGIIVKIGFIAFLRQIIQLNNSLKTVINKRTFTFKYIKKANN